MESTNPQRWARWARWTERMITPPGFTVLLLIAGVAACAQEATAPQGAAAISQVVPVVAPDVWCPATADSLADTVPAQYRCHTTVKSPLPPVTQDSTWHTMQGSLKPTGGSTSAASDTTR